ncbi:MAG: tetratricopeptide repeat protein [Gammaproteobacteria bacterium]|nr:tetratricopeptide repeat protein [Gammaproteobacteria bacterium]
MKNKLAVTCIDSFTLKRRALHSSAGVRSDKLIALCVSAIFLLPGFALAESGDDAMRMLRQQLELMPPEQRKAIEAELARQNGKTSTPAPISDSDIAVPKRDSALLARISRQPLTGAQLKAHIESLQPKLRSALTSEALRRAELIEDIERKAGGDLTQRLRQTANGLAAWGAWPEATYLIGKVALAAGQAQDLNNLAAFLTMQKVSQAALPILITLNARYPNNSTILNNLGQAWFELGEIEEARQTLTLAVRFSPNHPQANVTKSVIEEASGDKAAAQASMRAAIRGGFSEAKRQRLEHLGGKLQKNDVRWTLPMPADPLGLGKFEPPPYPMSMAELPTAIPAWQNFIAEAATRGAELNYAFAASQAGTGGKAPSSVINTPFGGSFTMKNSGPGGERMHSVPGPLAAKASTVYAFDTDVLQRKLGQLTSDVQQVQAKLQADWMDTGKRIADVRARCNAQPNFGGERCGCGEIGKIVNAYLEHWNGQLQPLQNEWLAWTRRKADADAYFAQYTAVNDSQFEDSKHMAEASYLNTLANLKAAGVANAEVDYCRPEEKTKPAKGGKLRDFDDLHCDYVSNLDLLGFGSIQVRCNKMITTFEPMLTGFKAKWVEDMNKDRVLSASVEVQVEAVTVGAHGEFDEQGLASGGVSVGAKAGIGPEKIDDLPIGKARDIVLGGDKIKSGPLEVGVEVKGSFGVEFDRSGITDVRVEASVGAKASSSVVSTDTASPGAEASASVGSQWSWNAGASGSTSGNFDRSFF